jgi:hypothetical protein
MILSQFADDCEDDVMISIDDFGLLVMGQFNIDLFQLLSKFACINTPDCSSSILGSLRSWVEEVIFYNPSRYSSLGC